MGDKNDYKYGFCPKCGALMQNGVCQSCGHGSGLFGNTAGDTAGAGTVVRKTKKKRSSGGKKVLAVVLLIVAVLLIIIGILFATIQHAVNQARRTPEAGYGDNYGDGYFGFDNPFGSGGDEDYGYGYDYDYNDEYVPSPDDEYYEEFVNSIDNSLDYHVLWKEISVYPDADDDYSSYYAGYPVLTSADGRFDRANELLEQMGRRYEDVYRGYENGGNCTGLVTYMDEEKVSVVFEYYLYGEDEMEAAIGAVTFDAVTGEEIPYSDMLEIDDHTVMQFRTRNDYQNSPNSSIDEMSDTELKEYLSDDEKRVLFYSPVGLEIGFNYPDGWVTVTLKDVLL